MLQKWRLSSQQWPTVSKLIQYCCAITPRAGVYHAWYHSMQNHQIKKKKKKLNHTISAFFQNQFKIEIPMKVNCDKILSPNYLSFYICIFNLDSFHLTNALSNALSDAFLIISQILLMICSWNFVARQLLRWRIQKSH